MNHIYNNGQAVMTPCIEATTVRAKQFEGDKISPFLLFLHKYEGGGWGVCLH